MVEAASGGIVEIIPESEVDGGEPADDSERRERGPARRAPKLEAVRKLGDLSVNDLETVANRAETDLDGVGTSLALFANVSTGQLWNPDKFFEVNSKIIRSIERIMGDLAHYEMHMQLVLDEKTAEIWNRTDPIVPINRATDDMHHVPSREPFHIGYENDGKTMWFAFSDVCQAVRKGSPLQLVHSPSGKVMHEYVWEDPRVHTPPPQIPEL